MSFLSHWRKLCFTLRIHHASTMIKFDSLKNVAFSLFFCKIKSISLTASIERLNPQAQNPRSLWRPTCWYRSAVLTEVATFDPFHYFQRPLHHFLQSTCSPGTCAVPPWNLSHVLFKLSPPTLAACVLSCSYWVMETNSQKMACYQSGESLD